MFAAETRSVTRGAAAWQAPMELGLTEVRLDGLLMVLDASLLAALPAPWSEAQSHQEIVIELKMVGDHLDTRAVRRAELRRLAREVQRAEDPKVAWDGDEPLWMVASHVPARLRDKRGLACCAPGCYRVDTGVGGHPLLWIASNELPLTDELIPFRITRSGRALDEFGVWAMTRRPPEWLAHVIEYLPMTAAVLAELTRYMNIESKDPAFLAQRRRVMTAFAETTPGVGDVLIAKGLAPLVHQFERRLGRRLAENERHTLQERLDRIGSERLGDVVFDLTPEALATWLADPNAR